MELGIGPQIYAVSSNFHIEDTISEEYKQQYAASLIDTLIVIKTESHIDKMYLYPNFQFGFLQGPSGYVCSFKGHDLYRQGAFTDDKLRSITAVRLRMPSESEGGPAKFFAPDNMKEVEKRLKICLPIKNLTPPELGETIEGGFGASLGEWGTSISIGKSTVNDEGRLKDIYWCVCHCCLPDSFIDKLQERDRRLNSVNVDYIENQGNVKDNIDDFHPTNYETEFNINPVYKQARQVAEELPKRLMYLWSKLVGLELDVSVPFVETETILRTPQRLNTPSEDLMARILKENIWPKGALIQPNSYLPNEDFIPKELRGYEIGLAVSQMSEGMRQKVNLNYDDGIITFTPDKQILYNYLETDNNTNQLHYYNQCCYIGDVSQRNQGWIIDKGIELGFDVYNYDPINRIGLNRNTRITNTPFGNGFPCVWPYRTDLPKFSPPSSSPKFFSYLGGGYTSPSTIPEQLYKGKSTYQDLSEEELSKLIPQSEYRNKFTIVPIHGYLSPKCYNAPKYNINNI